MSGVIRSASLSSFWHDSDANASLSAFGVKN